MANDFVSISDLKCTSKEGHNMTWFDSGRKDNVKMMDYKCPHCGLQIREKTEMTVVAMGKVSRKGKHRDSPRHTALRDISEYIKSDPEWHKPDNCLVTSRRLALDKDIARLNAELGIHSINKTPERMRRNSKKFKSIHDELGSSWQVTGFL